MSLSTFADTQLTFEPPAITPVTVSLLPTPSGPTTLIDDPKSACWVTDSVDPDLNPPRIEAASYISTNPITVMVDPQHTSLFMLVVSDIRARPDKDKDVVAIVLVDSSPVMIFAAVPTEIDPPHRISPQTDITLPNQAIPYTD
jgi:hypothetical protein